MELSYAYLHTPSTLVALQPAALCMFTHTLSVIPGK
jgi:hypothetical protein